MASVFGNCEMTDVSGIANVIFPDTDCYNKVRGCLLLSSMRNSRSSSLSSDKSTEKYVARMQRESDNMDQDDPPVPATNSLLVEYETTFEQALHVSKVADTNTSMRQQCALTVGPILNQTAGVNVFNVQLNYDSDQALDPDLWDGNFHVVSLHGSMKHLALDALNIKESLLRMRKYILGKSIESDKANKVEDFKSMGKAM